LQLLANRAGKRALIMVDFQNDFVTGVRVCVRVCVRAGKRALIMVDFQNDFVTGVRVCVRVCVRA
jgi:nicotinamidase-related amidase